MKSANNRKLRPSPLREALVTCKVMFRHSLIFGLILNCLMLATPIYSMQVLDRVISSSNTDTLLMLTIVIGLALGLMSFLQFSRSLAMSKMGTWFEQQLGAKLFSHAVVSSLTNKGSGGSQQLRDLQTIKTYLTGPSLLSMVDIPWAAIFLFVLFIIHPAMGTMTLLGGIIIIGLGVTSDRFTKELHESSNELFVSSMKIVDQATRNAEVIHVMGLLPNVIGSWQDTNKKVQDFQTLVSIRQNVFGETTKFIRQLFQILVTGVGAYLVLKGEMSTGAIIACSSLAGRALAPFEQAIGSWKGFLNSRKAYERLEDSLEKYTGLNEKMNLPEPKGKISAENLYFSPPGSSKHVIKSVSMSLEPGEICVVIGPSASGKTTLAKLLVGAWTPQIGTVRMDNANLEDWNRDQLGKYIGYLPQDVELFSGTVKSNISRLDPAAKDEDIIFAAQMAGVHDMILQLPKGYETEIGPDGSALSGGQRQRIGLARAFYGQPKLFVLDEPNANLDSYGELALANAIARAKDQGITTIIISHRTSLLNVADKILAMKDGMVAIFGSRDEVLEKMNQASNPVPYDLTKRKA